MSYSLKFLLKTDKKKTDKDFTGYVFYHHFSPKLKMLYNESRKEKNILFRVFSFLMGVIRGGLFRGGISEDFAVYPRSYYKTIEKYDHTKTIDYCFIGAYKMGKKTEANRKWIIDFIKTHFTDSSYLQFTDQNTKKNYIKYGSFDYTIERTGFVPKEHPEQDRNFFDENYFKMMTKSKFALCPAGDAHWSMRFYEAIMCKSIPIVDNKNETFRSKAESILSYKYYLTTERHIYLEDWAEHNYKIFLKYHTFEFKFW